MKGCEVVVDSPKMRPEFAKRLIALPFVLIFVLGASLTLSAQATDPSHDSATENQDSADPSIPPVVLKSLPRNLFIDQKNLVTAPFHLTYSHWQWTVPLASPRLLCWPPTPPSNAMFLQIPRRFPTP